MGKSNYGISVALKRNDDYSMYSTQRKYYNQLRYCSAQIASVVFLNVHRKVV